MSDSSIIILKIMSPKRSETRFIIHKVKREYHSAYTNQPKKFIPLASQHPAPKNVHFLLWIHYPCYRKKFHIKRHFHARLRLEFIQFWVSSFVYTNIINSRVQRKNEQCFYDLIALSALKLLLYGNLR